MLKEFLCVNKLRDGKQEHLFSTKPILNYYKDTNVAM